MNFQRIADMALAGVKSTAVKGDHLFYHSAQLKGRSDFVEFHESEWGSRWLCSLIIFQDYSISSFLSNLYQYFTKQWRNHHDFWKNAYCFWTAWFLLCHRFMVNTSEFSSVILQLCVWTRLWRAPIVEFTHSFTCWWMRFRCLQRFDLMQAI